MRQLLAAILIAGVAYAQDRDLSGYTLVFSDEFNDLSIGWHEDKGSARWSVGAPYGPASSFSFSHWGIIDGRWKVWTVDNGILRLHTIYDSTINQPNDRNWVSGILASKDRQNRGFAQCFGYWSAKIKMPNAGQGAWPAFWLASTAGIPSGGGDGYEIDIMEFYGSILEPGSPPTYNEGPFYDFLVHAWQDTGGQNEAFSGGQGHIPVSDPISNWHVYGCEVNPNFIIGYLDGVEVAKVPTGAKYISEPLYIILNYAMRNDHGGQPFANNGSSFMQVDWVRAYSLPALPAPTNLRVTGP